jgi:hypothetical protein
MYHLELRQFPHVARAFNLDQDALYGRFVQPWVGGAMIDYDDRRWSPERTKLTVLEGPEIVQADMGLGRGWGVVTKSSRDVTEDVLAEVRRGAQARPEVAALTAAVAEVAGDALAFQDVMALAAAAHPTWRASEQLSLAEQTVWEMLHRGQLTMIHADEAVPSARWQAIVLSWATWAGVQDAALSLRTPAPGDS